MLPERASADPGSIETLGSGDEAWSSPAAMKATLLAACVLCGLACATAPRSDVSIFNGTAARVDSSRYAAIVNAADRPAADEALDLHRKPEKMLEFFAVHPGMHVAELAAGGGYTTELLARAVAPGGVVYSQNPPRFLRFAGKAWTARLKRPALSDVVRVERPMDDPLPPKAKGLDVVVSHIVYHDTVWMKVDRDRMNRAVFAALKPGGYYVVIDSSAKPGAGTSVAGTLHRIDEKTVREEVERAGFRLASTSDAWRNPADTRDWSSSPRAAGARRGTEDRFALRFVKP